MSESIWNDARITAYVLDEMSADQRAAFEQEMNANAQLATAVADAVAVTGKLQALYAAEPTRPLDPERRDSILALPQSAPPIEGVKLPAKRAWYRPTLLKFVVAASILMLLGGLTLPTIQSTRETADRQLRHRISEPNFWTLPTIQSTRETADSRIHPSRQIDSVAAAPAMESDDADFGELRYQHPTESQAEPSMLFAHDQDLDGVAEAATLKKELASSEDLQSQLLQLGASPTESESELAESKQNSSLSPPAATDKSPMLEADSLALPTPQARSDQVATAEQEQAQTSTRATTSPSPATPLQPQPTQRRLRKTDADGLESAKSMEGAGMMGGLGGGMGVGSMGGGMGADMYGAEMAGVELSTMEQQRPVYSPIPSAPISGQPDYSLPSDQGRGPGIAGDRFDRVEDNPFKRVSEHPLSTFSVDVDTASYSKVRDFLMRANQLPRPDAVRIEEMINYFDYDYQPPVAEEEHPFAARAVVTQCPWNPQHRLARVALKGKETDRLNRPRCNLVFLIDTSGSMNAPNKLPLVQQGMKMLLSQLHEQDRVAIVVYAGSAGLVLDSSEVADGARIRKALTQLAAGGSTNGGDGIMLAYQVVRDNFIADGVNRVILCTDGDFNVGTTGTDSLVRLVEKEAADGAFLSVLGFGMGNHNDSMLEQISGRGNGNYAFIDTENEAKKVLVRQASGTLVTIAKDVKVQIEFNPTQVSSYRLIGYENRVLAKEDFNDDQKDAGEIGAGHSVTALYEIVPTALEPDTARPKVDDLKYQTKLQPTGAADSDEMMTVKLRYKQPDGDVSTLVEFPVIDQGIDFVQADDATKFATAVAGFGMQLRQSEYRGTWTLDDVARVAKEALGEDPFGLRSEFIELVQKANQLVVQE